jgi:hypothetical protein
MKTALLALPLLALMGACSPSPEELLAAKAPIERQLPPGCLFRDLGSYRGRLVVAVFCKDTTSTSVFWNEGKIQYEQIFITKVGS